MSRCKDCKDNCQIQNNEYMHEWMLTVKSNEQKLHTSKIKDYEDNGQVYHNE